MFRRALASVLLLAALVAPTRADARAPSRALLESAVPRERVLGPPVADTLAVLIGRMHDEWLGVAVAGAGDVNGDGFGDWIVGAYANDDGGPDGGRADVYYGGPTLDLIPDLTMIGHTADYFGTAVGGGGDVNGDGFADVVVGSPADDTAAENAGSVFVWFGGAAADTIPDLTLRGEAANDFFGQSAAIAGDVNGDGFADVVVGAWRNDAGGADAGRVYVYFGGAAPDSIADLVLTGEESLDNFGFAVAAAGDVNGDRFDDLVVGAPYYDGLGYNVGRAYVYLGGAAPDTIPDLVLDGEGDFHDFGFSVAGAGDVDGDDFDDLLVGAVFAGTSNAGRAYLFRGGLTLDPVADAVLDGENASDQLGCSVAGAGDVNRDGFADFLVGSFHDDTGGRDAGRVFLCLGGPGPNAVPDLVLTGAATLDAFGFAVSKAGDLDHDGWPDFLVGAPLAAWGASRPGIAYAFSIDASTPSLLASFRAETRGSGVELFWRFAPEAEATEAAIERAERLPGPWSALDVAAQHDDGGWVARDERVVPGRTYFYRLVARDAAAAPWRSAPIAARVDPVLVGYRLAAPFPSPVRDRFTVALVAPVAGPVTLRVLDLQGRAVATLHEGPLAAGRHAFRWSVGGTSFAPGLYWVALEAAGVRLARRLVVAF